MYTYIESSFSLSFTFHNRILCASNKYFRCRRLHENEVKAVHGNLQTAHTKNEMNEGPNVKYWVFIFIFMMGGMKENGWKMSTTKIKCCMRLDFQNIYALHVWWISRLACLLYTHCMIALQLCKVVFTVCAVFKCGFIKSVCVH